MSSLTVFDIFFTNKKSRQYTEALDSLNRVSDIISNITLEFPDVSSKEIFTKKNKWVELPKEVASGVFAMGLHLEEDYMSLLVHFDKNSNMKPHFYSKEWEIMMILDGEAYDKEQDTVLTKGDVYIVPRGALHHIVTRDSECYMYTMYSSNKHNLKISDKDKEIAKQMIDKKHSFKA